MRLNFFPKILITENNLKLKITFLWNVFFYLFFFLTKFEEEESEKFECFKDFTLSAVKAGKISELLSFWSLLKCLLIF